ARRVHVVRGDRVIVALRLRLCVVQVPDEALHARLRGKNARRSNPVERDVYLLLVYRLRFVVTRKSPDEFTCAVEDFEHDGRARVRLQIVVDDRAVGRVLAHGFFGRERRVRVDVTLNAVGRLRLKEKRVRRRDAFVNLPERRDVVENPEGATVRADDDVVPVYDDVADGRRSHVETKGQPVVAV